MSKRIIGATLLSLLVAPALAQQAPLPVEPVPPPAQTPAGPAPDAVLATVDGTTITGADLATAYDSIGEAVQRVPPEQRDEMLLSLLVDMQLMANAAEAGGLAGTPEFGQRMAFVRRQSLQEEYMSGLIAREITPATVEARYRSELGQLPPEQLSASHILVADEERAKALIAELDGGADFGTLAQQNSADQGSAANGGALGFFSAGQMVPEFEAAAAALEVGAITPEPVRSQFGWHIIRLDERRAFPVPPLAKVEDQIRQVLVREAYISEIDRLKTAASIERPRRPTRPRPALRRTPPPPSDPAPVIR